MRKWPHGAFTAASTEKQKQTIWTFQVDDGPFKWIHVRLRRIGVLTTWRTGRHQVGGFQPFSKQCQATASHPPNSFRLHNSLLKGCHSGSHSSRPPTWAENAQRPFACHTWRTCVDSARHPSALTAGEITCWGRRGCGHNAQLSTGVLAPVAGAAANIHRESKAEQHAIASSA